MNMVPPVPYGATTTPEGLGYLAVEVSFGGQWIDINDGDRFIVGAESRDSSAKAWRKVTTQSPILGGSYLIHAVPEMVTETVSVWIHGADQTDLNDNYFYLMDMFEQYDFRIRWTFNEYREYWRCQLAENTASRGQVWTHNTMAQIQFSVPRFPNVTRERID